jgi:hypothetical protein
VRKEVRAELESFFADPLVCGIVLREFEVSYIIGGIIHRLKECPSDHGDR